MADVVAVVPLKALSGAKGRLTEVLDPDRRRALALWMCERVLDTAAATPSIERVVLVAGDEAAAEAAAGRDVEVVIEREAGLDAAMRRADAHLSGAPAVLVIAGDLPLLRAADLDAVCAAGALGPAVVVSPTVDGGTGALLRRPAGILTCAFGPSSARRHLQRAAAAGVRGLVLQRRGLRYDVDTPAQLDAVARNEPALRSWLVAGADYPPAGTSAYPC